MFTFFVVVVACIVLAAFVCFNEPYDIDKDGHP